MDLQKSAHTVATHDVPSQIVYCARPSNVELDAVDGKVLLEDGQPAGMDEAAFLAEAQLAGVDLVRRLEAERPRRLTAIRQLQPVVPGSLDTVWPG